MPVKEPQSLKEGMDADLAPVALIVLTRKRSIAQMNLAAEKLIGLSRNVAGGRRLSQLVYHDNPLFDVLDAVEETGRQVVTGSLRLMGPSLDERLVHVSVDLTAEGGFVLALSGGTLPDTCLLYTSPSPRDRG